MQVHTPRGGTPRPASVAVRRWDCTDSGRVILKLSAASDDVSVCPNRDRTTLLLTRPKTDYTSVFTAQSINRHGEWTADFIQTKR